MSPGQSVASDAAHAVLPGATPPETERHLDPDCSALGCLARSLTRAGEPDVAPLVGLGVLARSGRLLDEFFQLRAALLGNSGERARAVRRRVLEVIGGQDRLLAQLRPGLAGEGLELCCWESLDGVDRRFLAELFAERFAPVLAPLAPGPSSLPAASLSLSLAVGLRRRRGGPRLSWVELPPVLPRMVPLRGGRWVPVEQVVARHLPALFPEEPVGGCAAFRVTRDAVPAVPDAEGSVGRERLGRAVRLEVEPGIGDDALECLVTGLDLTPGDVYVVGGLLASADLALVAAASSGTGARPSPAPAQGPAPSRPYAGSSSGLLDALEAGDVLVHTPYDAGSAAAALLAEAATDPDVLAIKQTLYRPSPGNPVVRALARAAERGIPVVAVADPAVPVEKRETLASVRILERAGAHVVSGPAGLTAHCRVTLCIRRTGAGVRRLSLFASGADPGRGAEGLALASSSPDLGADLGDLFNELTGYARPTRLRKLMVAPASLRSGLLELIRREEAAGAAGRIGLKIHRLVDPEVVDALYAASQAGARVDIVVAGACSLRPGVVGLSEDVRVVAPAGLVSETSRFFVFGRGEEAAWYLSSADLASRHLDRQVNVAVPVEAIDLKARLEVTLDALVTQPAFELGPEGVWRRRPGPGPEGRLRALAAAASRLGRARSR